MKTALYISVLLVFVLIAVSCKKVELDPTTPPTSSSPVFHAAMVIDGDSNLIEVGENVHLTSYHDIVGIGSYFGTSYTNISGDDLLSFEFGLINPLNSTSLSSGVNFGSLECYYELDVNDVFSNVPITLYAWEVDGTSYVNTNAPITEFGEHDVTFLAILANGSEVTLKDRITVGGVETNEPEVTITNLAPDEYVFSAVNIPNEIDSIEWEVQYGNGLLLTSNEIDFYFISSLPFENCTVTCSYFSDGSLVNYWSQMHVNPTLPNTTFVDIDFAVTNLENSALPTTPNGKVTYNHNGVIYTTRDNTVSNFSMSNMNIFLDEYTSETYLKGSLTFESYLHNSSGDSIYVELSSEIGFSDMPD